ncbi:M23 family metallopeptidase [Aliikangiella maris]|uniref:M23 family metallopeptidase n=2 Tax=Aliikangiella maris TaxID=3162458 RepID=A0ABV3MQS6_9GAMM
MPERKIIPVKNATVLSWNANTFWYEPWGSSGVHKGIDIFAAQGTPVLASTDMLILYRGIFSKGGNVVLGLGPKWRLHYFAHMQGINKDVGFLASKGQLIGTVGDTGNARGKPPHLHFSIVSIIPLPWLIDRSTQGFKKAFYLNPIEYLTQ